MLIALNVKAQYYQVPIERFKSGFDVELGGSSPIISIQYKRYYHINTKSFITAQFGWGKIFGDDLYSYPFGMTFQKRIAQRAKNPCNPTPINRKKIWYWHVGTSLTTIPKRNISNQTLHITSSQFGLGYLTGQADFPYMIKFSLAPIYIIETDIFLPILGITFSIFDNHKTSKSRQNSQ